jgi:hypothetical protein
MLKKNSAYIKLLIGTTIGTLIIASAIMVNFQNRKINKLEDELYLKQQNEQRTSDYYQSILNEKTIQTKFNTLQEYPILKDCTVQMEHTYEYSKEDIKKIFGAIEDELKVAKMRFEAYEASDKGFKLR